MQIKRGVSTGIAQEVTSFTCAHTNTHMWVTMRAQTQRSEDPYHLITDVLGLGMCYQILLYVYPTVTQHGKNKTPLQGQAHTQSATDPNIWGLLLALHCGIERFSI